MTLEIQKQANTTSTEATTRSKLSTALSSLSNVELHLLIARFHQTDFGVFSSPQVGKQGFNSLTGPLGENGARQTVYFSSPAEIPTEVAGKICAHVLNSTNPERLGWEIRETNFFSNALDPASLTIAATTDTRAIVLLPLNADPKGAIEVASGTPLQVIGFDGDSVMVSLDDKNYLAQSKDLTISRATDLAGKSLKAA